MVALSSPERREIRRIRLLKSLAQQFFQVAEALAHEVQLVGETLNLRMGAAVDIVIEFAAEPVLLVLPVLAHHDQGRLDRGQHREEEVEEVTAR